MRAFFLAALLLASPAAAQISNPIAGSDDVARSLAQQAQSTADSKCTPMPMVSPVEVPGGTTGSGANCRLVNAANNRISRTGVFTITNGQILCGGSTTCSWTLPLPAGADSYPIFFTAVGASAAVGVKCKVTSTSNTGFTGAQCVQAVATVSLLGAAVEVAASSGTQVFALSLPSTQASQ